MISTLLDLFSRFRELGHREAFLFDSSYRTDRLTYHQFLAWIGSWATYLKGQRISKGDRVVLWAENRLEWPAAFWGVLCSGAVVVPVDDNFSFKLVDRICEDTEPKLLIHGQSVDHSALRFRKVPLKGLPCREGAEALDHRALPDDIVEIVFTSGTTGNPKGVVHRHGTLVANLRPFAEEISRYRWLARPFQPIRILDLLPLSHMFGQSLGLFIPALLGGSCVFTSDLAPLRIAELIRRHKISVLVSVPRTLAQFRDFLSASVGHRPVQSRRTALLGIADRWWKNRHFHSELGWKFWAIVAGGASVPSDLENFWKRIGIAFIQGYGLTEAGPIVALNHPFHAQAGSIGKALPGQEVKLAEDGEILVRGASVVNEYWSQKDQTAAASIDGWLHTGDVGQLDQKGNLFHRGRKRDIIVTSNGLNVYPEDIEAVLNAIPEVKESVVVATERGEGDTLHAALLLKNQGIDAEAIIARANSELETHQRIQGWTVWPDRDFPRTPSTLKIQRQVVLKMLEKPSLPGPASQSVPAGSLVERVLNATTETHAHAIGESRKLAEDLGLSSLDRIDLLARLEESAGKPLDEDRFAEISTVGELRQWYEKVTSSPADADGPPGRLIPYQRESSQEDFPHWATSLPARIIRWGIQRSLILPLFRYFVKAELDGLSLLSDLSPPVIFAANHSSHLDALAILSSLPRAWRGRLAPAMLKERFAAHFNPTGFSLKERGKATIQYLLACLLFNAFPFAQRSRDVRSTLRYVGALASRDFCPLIFPEGKRTPDGKLLPFKGGTALLGMQLDIPIIPVYLKGLFELMPLHASWPKSGTISVFFGRPMNLSKQPSQAEATRALESAIKELAQAGD